MSIAAYWMAGAILIHSIKEAKSETAAEIEVTT